MKSEKPEGNMHQWLRGVPGPMVVEAKCHEVVQFIDSVLEAAQKEPKMAHMKLQIFSEYIICFTRCRLYMNPFSCVRSIFLSILHQIQRINCKRRVPSKSLQRKSSFHVATLADV